jgi:lipid-A-disaccharide synthase
MEAAGAEIIERTGDAAVMGMPGLQKIREHKQINERIEAWVKENPVDVHVPVDSPAANFPVCSIMKAQGGKVVHMVAPQLWAWAPWRIRKLRRLTDHVMCVLPFEEEWFGSRGVEATFIGHPLFEKPIDERTLDEQTQSWQQGEKRIAILPGSRPSEIKKNFPLLIGAYSKLKAEHKDMCGMVAVTRPEIEPIVRQIAKDHGIAWPDSLGITHANTDAVVRWCTLAMVVSGTVTLQIARQHRPMVIVYKLGRIGWSLLARWLIQTPFITLPNILAGREVVPELVPHFVGAEPIAERVTELLEDRSKYDEQVRELTKITDLFASKNAAVGAADIIARYAGLEPVEPVSDRDGEHPESEARVARSVSD